MALDSSEVGFLVEITLVNLFLLFHPWFSPILSLMSYNFEINEKDKRF